MSSHRLEKVRHSRLHPFEKKGGEKLVLSSVLDDDVEEGLSLLDVDSV